MADIGRGIRTYLVAQSGVSDLISTRMYPDILPQDTAFPSIVYAVISDITEHHLSAASNVSRSLIQIDCFASSRLSANALAEAVRAEMDGYRGSAGSESVLASHMRNRSFSYDMPDENDDVGLYRVMLEFLVWHTESVPTF